MDFEALYDSKPEYVERRDPTAASARRVALEVRKYKIPHLVQVMPPEHRYRSILEIGSATGELIEAFPGDRVTRRLGIDISPLNVAAARERFPRVEFVAGDFRKLAERFDLVILSDVLEHVEDDVGFLRDASRLAPVLLLNLPLEKCLSCAFRVYGPQDRSGHLRAYSLSDGFRTIAAAGLEPIHWIRVWPFETSYEQERRRFLIETTGSSISGRPALRAAKALAVGCLRTIRPAGRAYYASNLFASVRARDS